MTRADEVRHGTTTSYHRGCHCTDCRDAWRRYSYAAKKRRVRMTPFHLIPHGVNGYANYLCRCDVCSSEWKAYTSERRWIREAMNVGA